MAMETRLLVLLLAGWAWVVFLTVMTRGAVLKRVGPWVFIAALLLGTIILVLSYTGVIK